MLKSPSLDAAVISLQDVNVTLSSLAGAVDILKSITLDVHEGESLSITGPSGSGKTTLLMVMAGLERITSGVIRVCDAELTTLNEDQLALLRGQNIGIVFQSFHLVPTMTALENVMLPLEFLDRKDSLEQAREALAKVQLSHRHDHFPAQLSGGERQRVALARAIVPKPKLLLADEPTGNLDGATGQQIIDLMFDLHGSQGSTLVLITHDTKLASLCQRQIQIEDGRFQDMAPLEPVDEVGL
ncbi:MAG: ATP-binding cassette domain-containing protein [Pseudomonadota bacterium]